MKKELNLQKFNIPVLHSLNNRVKIIEVLKVGESVSMGEYSAEKMCRISSSISYFKTKKGNSNKKYCQRQIEEDGILIIKLWRTK